VDNPEDKKNGAQPPTNIEQPASVPAEKKDQPKAEKREQKMCAFDPTQKAITECHRCAKPLGKTALFKANKKNTCVECVRIIRDEYAKQPLTFGRWFICVLVASAFALIPVALWGAGIGYLIYTDGPTSESSVKLYDYFDRLFPLVGFAMLVLVGLGWRVAGGRSRGGATMLWSAIHGIFVLILMFAINFVVLDNLSYPYGYYTNKDGTAVGYTKYGIWVGTFKQDFIEKYNAYLRDTLGTGDEYRAAMATIPAPNVTLPDFKKWYYEDYNVWVDKVVEYNKWAPGKGYKTMPVPEKHVKWPREFQPLMQFVGNYMLEFPAHFSAHLKDMRNGSTMLIISIIVWFFGLLYGSLWLPRSRYLNIVTPQAGKKEGEAKADSSKKHEEEKKPEGGEKPPEENKPTEQPKTEEKK